ncbi:MAG TPA: acyl-CoA thioesterase [Burkholderiales bacterium]|nr:acyl-CoA thioesterase [Burkholderiales bacterium]
MQTQTEPTELPRDREPVLRVVPMPADANSTGDIFGGWIMSQVDIAGSIPAIRLARGRVATVAVNAFVFKQPVLIGDLVSFYAQVVKVGRTSITVDVEVFAQRGVPEQVTVKVTEATLTYVAVDQSRKPRPVAPAAG